MEEVPTSLLEDKPGSISDSVQVDPAGRGVQDNSNAPHRLYGSVDQGTLAHTTRNELGRNYSPFGACFTAGNIEQPRGD